MNKNWTIGIIAAIILIAGGWYFSSNQYHETKKMTAENDSRAMKKDLAMEDNKGAMQNGADLPSMTENKMQPKPEEAVMEKETDKTTGDKMPQTKAGVYVDYTANSITDATENGGKAVLFFHAAWCPFCKTADAAFKSRASEIPSGVTVIKTDYDTQKELKTKYGVTYQHTFVQVDSQGNLITKWNGGDIESLKANLK